MNKITIIKNMYYFDEGTYSWLPWIGILVAMIMMAWIVARIVENRRKKLLRNSAMDILKKKYSNGEISKFQFDQKKKELYEKILD
ncbi:MAG: hypothetical protein ACOCUL_02080 [Bacteroidota bacterium]